MMSRTRSGRIAIAGVSGFVGRHLVSELTRDGGLLLRGLSRRIGRAHDLGRGVEVLRGDLAQREASTRLVRRGDVVVNAAYDRRAPAAANLTLAENLAEACLDAGACHLIHVSTAVVAGRARGPLITEATACRPVTEYQRVKLELENLLSARLRDKVPLTIVRPTAIFGPGGRNGISTIRRLRSPNPTGAWVRWCLSADRRLHLVPIATVVAAIRLLIDRPPESEETYIVSEDEVEQNNYRDVVIELSRALGLRSPTDLPTLPVALQRQLLRIWLRDAHPNRIFSSRKLAGLGFERPIHLTRALREFAVWYRASERHRG